MSIIWSFDWLTNENKDKIYFSNMLEKKLGFDVRGWTKLIKASN